MNPVALLLLAGLLATAVVSDLRFRRIPNACVLAGLVLGIGCQVYSANAQPLSGIGTALLGAATGLLLLLPSYLLRAMGAGDVKLMAAVGAFLGPMAVAGAAILTFVAGGLLSLSVALASGSMRRVARNLQVMILTIFTGRATGMALKDVPTTGRLPYAVAIACGTALQLAAASQSRWFFS